MQNSAIIEKFAACQSCKKFISEISVGKRFSIAAKCLAGSSKAVLAANVLKNQSVSQKIHFFIFADKDDAAYFYNDLYNITQCERVLFFPSSYKNNTHWQTLDDSGVVQRTNILNLLKNVATEPVAVVSYAEAVAEKVVSREELQRDTVIIKRGIILGIDVLCDALANLGFERTDFVFEPGQYAVRGSIVDIFSFSENKPYRVDFFGDDVETIRTFDLNTQLSAENREQIEIISNTKNNAQTSSIFDFADKKTVFWYDNQNLIADKIEQVFEESADTFISKDDFTEKLQNFSSVLFSNLNLIKTSVDVDFETSPQPNFNKNFELLLSNIKDNEAKGYKTVILFDNISQSERLSQIFQSISNSEQKFFESVNLSLHEGFVDNQSKTCYYTDHQIFQRYHRFKIRGELDKGEILNLQELNKLQLGDYIVHIDHGVGVFGGLIKQEINGKIQEVIKLVYRDGDVLFVNIHGLHRISKYKDKDSEPPKIYKLGNGDWQRLKQITKKKVKDIAQELILLYAKRKATQGHAFAPDSYMQHELEASFIYEDTPDQLKASNAVKNDMESSTPMDRLVCGDVGFGKTEIAIRAAFKAVADSKQVAVLVPTTILALQHCKTFKDRLRGFPVEIDFFNRLKSAKQQTDTLQRLESGKLDIIIGTHKLLGKNVKFKDLGLLIIDEEQKFGVSAKEKLRKIKLNVDTLTLTATPIPRTLQFSLMGARDLSIINTPPPNRQPIITEVHTFNEDIIRDAINYEIERGGQVFFVHNRVNNIKDVENLIRKICPKARIAVGHGQMEPTKLEDTMLGFIEGDFDVLLCTTIIESGLDIPNANTIIVNQAQNFGLSDLHQLRGRVGRSNRRAYCYLLTPPPIALTDDARRRLKAIEEFSDLGSGFNISMQDLDIRGAGNLLGGEQSGFIADIGFETYQRILSEALTELKASSGLDAETSNALKTDENINYVSDCYIDTDIEAFLPDNYVSNTAEKIKLYKDLNNTANEADIQKFRSELIDRFGKIPPATETLFDIIRIRQLALQLGFERIVLRNGIMIAYFISNQMSAYYQSERFKNTLKYIQSQPRKFAMKESKDKLSLTVTNIKTAADCLILLRKMEAANEQ